MTAAPHNQCHPTAEPMRRCKHDVSEDCPACAEETIAGLKAELAEWKQAASVEAGLRREFSAQVEELTGALTDCVGCVAAAEAEGLHEVIAELRGFSEQTDRLIDLIERRLLWVRNYGDAALSPSTPAVSR